MSFDGILCDRFRQELDDLIKQVTGHTDGLNIADILLRAAVRELKACAGSKDDSRDEAVREMIQKAEHDVVMETYPTPQTSASACPELLLPSRAPVPGTDGRTGQDIPL
jgi:hypothetical protein